MGDLARCKEVFPMGCWDWRHAKRVTPLGYRGMKKDRCWVVSRGATEIKFRERGGPYILMAVR